MTQALTTSPRKTAISSSGPSLVNEVDRLIEVAEQVSDDVLACILPVDISHEQQVEQLQDRIRAMQAELEMMHRRDKHLNGFMQRLDEEQRLAARLQQDFLPKKLPEVGSVRFHTLFRPASYVSGDLYDVMRLDEKNVGFYVADAVGHGMPAALLTMFMKNALATKDIVEGGYRILEPNQTIARLNNAIVEQNLSNATFATALYGTINTETLLLNFSRGGHPNPLILRNGKIIELESDGALLGIFPDEAFNNCSFQLEPGDRVFIYTDGIEVAFAQTGPDDTERWREELHNRLHQTTESLLSDFAAHIDNDFSSLMPKDDLTVIAIDIR